MTQNNTMTAWVVATAAAVCLISASVASAQDDTETGTCVAACLSASRTCEETARDTAATCATDAGCDPLVDAKQAACSEDHESDECEAAREAADACLMPCRTALRTALGECRDTALTCVRDECGVEGLPLHCGFGRRHHGGGL